VSYHIVVAARVILWTVFRSDCGDFFDSIYEITGGSDISILYTEPSSESGPIYFITLSGVQARTGMW
jgi:hypothetical protein